MKTLITLIFASVALLTATVGQAQENEYRKELDAVFNSFKNKNYSLLKPIVDDQVKINPNIPVGMNDMVIPQVIAQLPSPQSYKVIKTEKVGGGYKFTVEYSYKERNARLQYFTFNEKRKIVDLDVLGDATTVEASIGTN
ncbi:hypothetical protein [Flavobacterium silvaticum]|uniref:DUF4251 domain-containing protein n=1 Tax=Flavobacterium silvaticum TaxID=1852020 RepID=A0A972FJY7_9FLAO|nr:hypothetical protein [Flavobacterium silvaticum]NMH27429.1 hypothetical protein [Flavobacterium silvaticum]